MSQALQAHAAALFKQRFGFLPDGTVFAPGRVNLIGEHVDYNNGLVMPMPLAIGTAVAWGRTTGDQIEVLAADFGEDDQFFASSPAKPDSVSWRSYVRGMAAGWGDKLTGMRIVITGDLPRGSGLSSSASLCIAIGRALAMAAGETIDARSLALRAQQTEHHYAGVACGIMDQMAVAAGEGGKAMLLDCRDLSFENLPVPTDWAVLVINSGVTRGLVDGEYNARRAQCEAAASAMGVASLRDADLAMLSAAKLGEKEALRASHIITEIARVRHAADALRGAELDRFGAILREGHASLRDKFEVSHPMVDELVDTLQRIIGEAGGARMTGAGFGGSVVAVLKADRAKELEAKLGRPVLRAA